MKILLIAIEKNGLVDHPSLCALGGAKILCQKTSAELHILVMGKNSGEAAKKLKTVSGAKRFAAPDCGDCVAERWASALFPFIRDGGYKTVIAPATSEGRDFMPRLAALMDSGMVSDVCGFEGELFLRYAHAGNAIAKVAVNTPTALVTLRETSFEPPEIGEGAAEVEELTLKGDSLGSRVVERREHRTGRPPLGESKCVVGLGRGIKNQEGLKLAEEIADLMGAAIGGSRAAVDEGFIQNDLQIGQTGKNIAPKLYFAFGISGAIQHTAGIKDAKVIAAINKDPEAPIFSVADYGLVADFSAAAPVLLQKLKNL